MVVQLQADEVTLQISGTVSSTEFLGYHDPGVFIPQRPDPLKGGVAPPGTVLPLPHYRLHQLRFNDPIADGQTLVLRTEAQDNAPLANTSGRARRLVVVLITPTLIDSAGNRIHANGVRSK